MISASVSGLVVEYIVAIDVTQVRFPADAYLQSAGCLLCLRHRAMWRAFVAQAQQSMRTLHTTQKLTGNPSTDEDAVLGHLARHETEFQRRGLEPRTLRLLAVRSSQLSYETN